MPADLYVSFPAVIRQIIGDLPFTENTIGMSGAGVLMFDDMVLKMAPADQNAAREIRMMDWLQDRLPVPKVVHTTVENRTSYLLMSRLQGEMACDECYME
ncbi:MAG: hypothetical protein IKY86_06340, partial [Clostridia bacterium]|nr:hypothetical protein [Clostridia bacterium]